MEESVISSDIELFSIFCVLLSFISEPEELFLIKPQVLHPPPAPQPVIAVAAVIIPAIKPKIFFFILF